MRTVAKNLFGDRGKTFEGQIYTFFGRRGRRFCSKNWDQSPLQEKPFEYLIKCAEIADIELQPVFQRQHKQEKKLRFPTIIYRQQGTTDYSPGFDGVFAEGVSIALDCRARSYRQAEEYLDKFLSCLVEEGRGEYLPQFLDEYDDQLGIYRRLATINIRI